MNSLNNKERNIDCIGVYDINDPTNTFSDGDIIYYDYLNGWQKFILTP